ncbi:hypothetical protein NC653_026197 [Populus alba x Populus x berolinensis]|nr:hypothetical protein NC653_026197 [Populus alba x Populus x berolinensis]
MGKLGKKAGKFAGKNLQSVLKRKMKVKSFFKKKTAKIFGEDDSDMDQDDSDSDGYLSEDASCSYNGETESENHLKVQNKEIHLELAQKMKRLNGLKAKVMRS